MDNYFSPDKIEVETILYKDNGKRPLKWSDIKHLELHDDDSIISTLEYDDNYWYIRIKRMAKETDDEYKERQETISLRKEELRQRRYEQYLKLKKEFENGESK